VAPLGIKGGIKVEVSPWVEDNLWVLDLIKDHPFIVGMIGNLDPLKAEFREYLGRYHRNKLFLGIRYGNIWGYKLVTAVQKPEFIDNVKEFATTSLTFETANPKLDLIEATLLLTDKVPELRVVLGHLPALDLPTARDVLKTYSNDLERTQKTKRVRDALGSHQARAGAKRSGVVQTDARFYVGHFRRRPRYLCQRLARRSY
jgi:predicted TIM-barrel fold metal-dependent hydrolase